MNTEKLADITKQIKAEALRLGFAACGASPAAEVDAPHRHNLERWLAEGCEADMAYMAANTDKRCDPRLLVEGARTVLSVAMNYYPSQFIPKESYQLAWYAYGEDYHTVMKEKLFQLLAFVKEVLPQVKECRAFCDTAPLLERYWAWRGGLGWIGKNTLLIIPRAGSTFFLGELVIDQPLTYDEPMKSRCGNCTRCLDACPTKALVEPYRLDARRCLSYLTIENRGEIPTEAAACMGNCIYGCDRCQQACPWNRYAEPCHEERFTPRQSLLSMTPAQWDNLTVEQYRTLFKGSAVKRAKYEGLMRNIRSRSQGQEDKGEV